MTACETVLSLTDDQRRDVMKAPDEVSAMLRLKALGCKRLVSPSRSCLDGVSPKVRAFGVNRR
jgi:hypothetical protein